MITAPYDIYSLRFIIFHVHVYAIAESGVVKSYVYNSIEKGCHLSF